MTTRYKGKNALAGHCRIALPLAILFGMAVGGAYTVETRSVNPATALLAVDAGASSGEWLQSLDPKTRRDVQDTAAALHMSLATYHSLICHGGSQTYPENAQGPVRRFTTAEVQAIIDAATPGSPGIDEKLHQIQIAVRASPALAVAAVPALAGLIDRNIDDLGSAQTASLVNSAFDVLETAALTNGQANRVGEILQQIFSRVLSHCKSSNQQEQDTALFLLNRIGDDITGVADLIARNGPAAPDAFAGPAVKSIKP